MSNKEYDAGYGTIDGRSCYWDSDPKDDGKVNVFPESGVPKDRHQRSPHEKIVYNSSGQITYWRDADGNILIDEESGQVNI